MVADIRAGREPDPTPGIIGKQRSVHNTYFTLPVLFAMISNHYPMTYSHPLRLGRARRDHAGRRADPAVLRAAAQGRGDGVAAPVLAVRPARRARGRDRAARRRAAAGGEVTFAQVQGGARRALRRRATRRSRRRRDSRSRRRASCWRRPEQIGQNAAKIAETVGNRYMPIGNLTQMTDDERAHRRRVVRAGREALIAPARCAMPRRAGAAAPRTSPAYPRRDPRFRRRSRRRWAMPRIVIFTDGVLVVRDGRVAALGPAADAAAIAARRQPPSPTIAAS